MSVKYEVKGSEFHLAVDSNDDGEPVLQMKLKMNEALKEAMKRGDAVEGAKVVGVEFSATKLMIKIDSDKDGESMIDLEIDLMEGFDEAKDAFI